MKAKYNFRNGKRYIFIDSQGEQERDFLVSFFNSPDDIEERLTPDSVERSAELRLSKRM